MAFRKMVLLIGAIMTFAFATFVSWYEGGQLRDDPWEWEHTAVFSNWLHDGVTNADDILVIDHFVYAAKFEPLFPLLMVTSFLVMFVQLAFWLFRRHRAMWNIFLLLLAAASLAGCTILSDSPTTGFQLFSLFFGVVGLLSILGVFRIETKKDKRIKTSNH